MGKVNIESDVPLAPLTTFRLGGQAHYFAQIHNETELQEALEQARAHDWPILVLAGGSNLIISDKGFDGLVLAINIKKLETAENKLTAGAANPMSELVDRSIETGLSGLEWAGGLPGSFGGAIRGNAGAYGGEIKDSIETVTSIDIETGKEIVRSNAECQFGYRDSIFKRIKEVIIEASLKLQSGDQTELRRIADDHIQNRQDKHPLEYPNCGSIFKNVPLERVPEQYLPLFADAVKNDPFPIVPTAKIIAVAGLKGMRVGNVQLSEKHTNYMVNLGDGRTTDLVVLIDKVKTEIRDRYQIELEVEPEIVSNKPNLT